MVIVNKENIKDIEILLCEPVEEIIKYLELEVKKAWKDGKLIFCEEDLEIFNKTGIF